MNIEGCDRLVVIVPHPNARGRRTTAWYLGEEGLNRVRAVLSEVRGSESPVPECELADAGGTIIRLAISGQRQPEQTSQARCDRRAVRPKTRPSPPGCQA